MFNKLLRKQKAELERQIEEKSDFLLFMKPDDFCSYGTTEREG